MLVKVKLLDFKCYGIVSSSHAKNGIIYIKLLHIYQQSHNCMIIPSHWHWDQFDRHPNTKHDYQWPTTLVFLHNVICKSTSTLREKQMFNPSLAFLSCTEMHYQKQLNLLHMNEAYWLKVIIWSSLSKYISQSNWHKIMHPKTSNKRCGQI